MAVKFITKDSLKKICNENKYIALRYFDLEKHYINCKVVNIAKHDPDMVETCYIGYYPCSFMEYISNKQPFI